MRSTGICGNTNHRYRTQTGLLWKEEEVRSGDLLRGGGTSANEVKQSGKQILGWNREGRPSDKQVGLLDGDVSDETT